MSNLIRSRKSRVTAALATAAVSLGVAASPAAAAPVVTGGLVNITIVDAVDARNINVQVPIGVAANVCGVQANLLAQGNIQEPVTCTSSTTQDLPVRFRPGNGVN